MTCCRIPSVVSSRTCLLLVTLSLLPSSAQSPGRKAATAPAAAASPANDAAIKQLTKVFGIERVPETSRHLRRRSAPEYMTELYQMVAYQDGISRVASPYDADVVRGILDKGKSRCYFIHSFTTRICIAPLRLGYSWISVNAQMTVLRP